MNRRVMWQGLLRLGILVLLLSGWPTALAMAQNIKVLASVDEKTVGTEDNVVYAIEIQGASGSSITTPRPPETEGLVLIQSIPSTQRNISIVNGNMQQSLVYRWTYRPVRQGTARILKALINIDNKVYETKAITIKVVAQSQRPRNTGRGSPLSPFARSAPADDDEPVRPNPQDLFIRAIPSARNAFQNEQVTVEYQLFFREGIQLRQSRLTDSWDAEGFWREELDVETRPIPRTVVENGLRYHTIVLKRAAVFPTHAGELDIDPLRIESEAIIPSTRSRDPFDRFFSRNRYVPVELASSAITVNAKVLPDNAPEGFNGTVGSFTMRTQVDRTEVEVGASVQVQVVLTGSGNLATMEAPDFEPPSIFEQYDPEVNTAINRTGSRIRGSKSFTYVMVPRSNGSFELPPIVFTYFDPQAEQYRTLRSEARTVNVSGTASMPLAISTTSDGMPVDDIAGVLSGTVGWVPTQQTPLHRRSWVYVLLLLPLLTLGGLYFYQRHNTRLATDVTYARNRRAHPLARKHLKQAEALLEQNEPRKFYEEIERAVRSFIGNRLNIAEVGLTHAQLDDHLAQRAVPEPIRQDLQALLVECDHMRFSPILPDRAKMETAHARASNLIVALNDLFAQGTRADQSVDVQPSTSDV